MRELEIIHIGDVHDGMHLHRERLLLDESPISLLTLLGVEPEPELSREDTMQVIYKLISRDEVKPFSVTMRINHAQEHGDTWRRQGKRKGRKGR
jgi:hypothetical protein